jgi:chromosome segregation ATPase
VAAIPREVLAYLDDQRQLAYLDDQRQLEELRAEVPNLREKARQAWAAVERERKAGEEVLQRIKDLKAEVEDLKSVADGRKKDVETYMRSLHDAKQRHAHEVEKLRAEVARYKEDFAHHQSVTRCVMAERDEAEKDARSLAAEVARLKKELEEAEERNVEAYGQLHSAEDVAYTKTDEVERLKKLRTADANKLIAERDGLRAEVAELTKSRAEWMSHSHEKSARVGSLTGELAAANAQNARLNSKVGGLETQVFRLKNELATLKTQQVCGDSEKDARAKAVKDCRAAVGHLYAVKDITGLSGVTLCRVVDELDKLVNHPSYYFS